MKTYAKKICFLIGIALVIAKIFTGKVDAAEAQYNFPHLRVVHERLIALNTELRQAVQGRVNFVNPEFCHDMFAHINQKAIDDFEALWSENGLLKQACKEAVEIVFADDSTFQAAYSSFDRLPPPVQPFFSSEDFSSIEASKRAFRTIFYRKTIDYVFKVMLRTYSLLKAWYTSKYNITEDHNIGSQEGQDPLSKLVRHLADQIDVNPLSIEAIQEKIADARNTNFAFTSPLGEDLLADLFASASDAAQTAGKVNFWLEFDVRATDPDATEKQIEEAMARAGRLIETLKTQGRIPENIHAHYSIRKFAHLATTPHTSRAESLFLPAFISVSLGVPLLYYAFTDPSIIPTILSGDTFMLMVFATHVSIAGGILGVCRKILYEGRRIMHNLSRTARADHAEEIS